MSRLLPSFLIATAVVIGIRVAIPPVTVEVIKDHEYYRIFGISHQRFGVADRISYWESDKDVYGLPTFERKLWYFRRVNLVVKEREDPEPEPLCEVFSSTQNIFESRPCGKTQ